MSEKSSDHNPLEEAAADLQQDRVDVQNSSARTVQGGHVSMTNSATRSVNAQALNMTNSAASFVRAKSLDMRESGAFIAVSQDATVHDGAVTVLASCEVQAKELRTGLLVASKVEGNVKTILTPLTALAIGAGFGLATLLLRSLSGRKRRSSAKLDSDET